MRNAKTSEVIHHKSEIFLRDFGAVLQEIKSDEDLEIVLKSLTRIHDSTWRSMLLDPQDPTRRITLLHATVLAIIFLSRNNYVRMLFLTHLIDITSYDLWDIKPPVSSSSELNSAIFNITPRECLFDLCKNENGNVFYALLRNLNTNMPLEIAAQHAVQYIEFFARVLLQEKENISIEMASLLASLSELELIDAELWFRPIEESSEPKMGLISLLLKKLSALIQLVEKLLFEAEEAGTLDSFLISANFVIHRRNMTYLIQIIYEIVKRAPSDHWNAQNPLDHLLGLVLVGSEHEFIVKIAQYVMRAVSQETLKQITAEKKERIAQKPHLAEFLSVLEGRETPPINLCDTLYLFSESLSTKSALLLSVLLPSQYVARLNRLSVEQTVKSELDPFSSFPPNVWVEKLAGRDCPDEFIGLTLLQAVLLILIKKISDPVLLCSALMRLVECVPAVLWDQPERDTKEAANAQLNATVMHSPRRLLWNLCLRENGHVFFPHFKKILGGLPLEKFQRDIPDYLKVVAKSFFKQAHALEFSSALLFYFLVACSPERESELFFRKMDISGDEKQKKKKQSAVVIIDSIINVLIDVFSAVMKTSRPNPQICELLLRSLIAIEKRSSVEDWGPDLTMNGDTDFNGPLNRLARLMLDDAQNPFLVKIVEAVLAKVTQESVNCISRENREKLLAMQLFAQNKKLMTVSREKKLAPKIAVAKVVPKPAAKKAVVPAVVSVNPGKKPVGKKMALKPSAKQSACSAKTIADSAALDSPASISTQQLRDVSTGACQQQNLTKNSDANESDDDGGFFPPAGLKRPTFVGSWAEDFDSEKDDSGSKKSVRYRHEPYSLFFNRRVIVKSGHDVTVSDVLCVSNGNKKGMI